jgi:hypothetical protein
MQKWLRIGGILTCLSGFASPSAAFDSFEHKAIGDLAMKLACMAPAYADAPVPVWCKSPGKSNAIPDVLTYGDLVQCVDLFLTPEKLFARLREETPDAQTGETDAVPALHLVFPDPAGVSGSKSKCNSDLLSVQAAHSNHAHFQDELLVSIATYHSLALTVARDQGGSNGTTLNHALLINAVADHYLQDLFAPGHVITRRRSLTDVVATAMHDARNERGAMFYANEPAGNMRDALYRMRCLLGPNIASHCTGEMKKIKESGEIDRDINTVLRSLLSNPKKKAKDKTMARPEQDMVLDAVDDLIGLEGKTRKDWICMKGDGNLWRENGTGCDDALHQRVFMVAANLTSILDVLQATNPAAAYANNFTNVAWKYAAPFRGDDLAYAALPFGFYSMGKRGPLPANVATNSGNKSSVAEPSMGQSQTPSVISGNAVGKAGGLPDMNARNFYFDNLVRIAVARESFYKGDRVGRDAFSIQTEPSWYSWHNAKVLSDQPIDLGLGVGLVGVREQDVQAGGGILQLLTTLPETESTLSLWTRRMYHGGNAEHGWRNGFGVGYEQGFTSMFALYVGMGRDFSAVSGGPLRQGTLFFGGVSLTFPGSRFSGWLSERTGIAKK